MNIAAAWPYVLAIAPVVVGSAAFAKTLLEIRKLQIEIRKLEGDESKQRLLETEQKIAQSTGRVRRFVFVFLIVSLAAAICITAFLRGQAAFFGTIHEWTIARHGLAAGKSDCEAKNAQPAPNRHAKTPQRTAGPTVGASLLAPADG